METLLVNFGLLAKIKGRNEFEMYKNFIRDVPEKKLDQCLNALFSENDQKNKNDAKAHAYRFIGNRCFELKDESFELCLHLYTKSLRYSTYNSESYAMAVANRSAVFFTTKDYKSCIMDIDVCLRANYPNKLKPKVLIRKAKCFEKMGDAAEMKKTLLHAQNIANGLSRPSGEKYQRTISDLLAKTDVITPEVVDMDLASSLPVIEENQSFANASSVVGFRHTKKKGLNVFAKKDIKRGDVLFVEKVFAFAPVKSLVNNELPHDFGNTNIVPARVQYNCQYCLTLLTSCVPCKTCVKHVYCNEQCRDLAWAEFHRWECYAVRSGMINVNNYGFLALRIIFKAMAVGFSVASINFEETQEYGSKDNNYTFVYNMYRNLHKLDECWPKLYAATAALWVHYLRKKTDFFKHMKRLPNYLNKSDKELMNYIGGLIMKHCIQLHTNIIPVHIIDKDEPKHVMTAITVCPSAALMKHSCLPNTSYYFVNDVLIVKAIEDIKENEEIFRSYITFVSTPSSIELTHAHEGGRKTMLKDLCFVDCKCKACVDPRLTMSALNAYLCVKCNGPLACTEEANDRLTLLQKDYKCLDCNYKTPLSKEMIATENFIIQLVTKFAQTKDLPAANSCRDLGSSIYVPTHPFYGTLYSELNDHYLTMGDMKEFLETGKYLITLCKKRRTGITMEITVLTYNYSTIAIDHLKIQASRMKVQDLGFCLNVLTEFLDEMKDVLDFYYPPFISKLNPLFDAVRELRILHTLRIANSEDE